MDAPHAVVLVSGGLDSATALALAREQGFTCHALSVDYGQRHLAELDAARSVAAAGGACEHRTMRVDLAGIGGSALTDPAIAVPETASAGIPVTYVPARNTLMLALALGWAEVLQAADLFIGVNVLDSSGYPDCRPQFIEAFQALAQLATRAGGDAARGRLRDHGFLLSGGCCRSRLRSLRLLPSAGGRICRGRGARPHPLPAPLSVQAGAASRSSRRM
jgi:7-cyano-7-deazaguanine synthase